MNMLAKFFLYGGALVLLFLVSLKNYLLFHSLAELFSIVIAFGIFVIGWNSRKYYKNNYLLFIGIAYLFVAFFDTLHTLAYKGMNIFKGYDDNNLPPQLWLVARYMESIALLLAPFFFSRPVRHWRIIAIFTAVSALSIYAIFFAGIFPVCFVTGSGLTIFKVGSEYLIDAILVAALYLLYKNKEHFEPGVLRLLTLSIVCTMLTELCFTVYVHLYGISNLVGHFFKIFSFWFMYRAIIETALSKPYDLLFRELQTKEEQFASAFNNAPIGVALAAPDGRWLKVNSALCVMVGYTEDELLSKTFQDITHPDDLDADLAQLRQVLDGSISTYQMEKRYFHKNGGIIWVLLSVSLVRDDEGNPLHFVSQIIDITNRKTIEKVQMFISERGWHSWEEEFFPALARFLSETLSMEFICIDRLTGYGLMARTMAVYHNGRFEDNIEYALKDTPCGDVVGKTICCFPRDVASLFPNDPVLREINAESYAGITLWGKNEEPIGLIALIGEKQFTNQQLVETVLRYVAPRAAGELERELAEEALRESEARFRSYYELGLIGMAITSLEKGWVQYNDCLCAMLGYSREELAEKSWVEMTHPDDLAADEAQFHRVLNGEIDAYQMEKRFMRKDGVFVHADLAVKCVRNEDGSPRHFVAMIKDITQRRQAQESLWKEKAFLRSLIDSAADLIYFKDINGVYLGCNKASESFTGLAEREQIGKSDFDFFDRELAEYIVAHDREVLQGGVAVHLEERVTAADGNKMFLDTVKAPIFGQDGQPIGLVGISRDITERKQNEDMLRESEERFAAAFNNAPIMISISNLEDGTYLDVNQRFLDISGFSREEIIGRTSVELGWISESDRNRLKESMLLDGRIVGQEFGLRTKSGQSRFCTFWGETVMLAGQKRLLSIALDITEQRRVEQQLLQAQKMESIGSLAGGVAHDFNNMLTVIMGHAQLGLMRLDAINPASNHLTEIMKTAERSADLTRQLLAFARKQAISPKILDLNEVIDGMLKMLRRLIGEDIHLAWHPAPGLWQIEADPSQIDQILANLCVNARDAIKDNGRITIETRNNCIDSHYCEGNPEAVPGEYVHLSVSDDGSGMDNEIMAHVFEPFFTTKNVGEGTGLGLATVYGIVKQNNGFINVYSESGKGTTFTIHLPRRDEKNQKNLSEVKTAPLPEGQETILLVEDEPDILETTSQLLSQQGYTLLTAGTPGEAMRLAQKHAGEISLLITDVIMPEMNGKELADRIHSLNPRIKCIYISGYTADIISRHGVLDEGMCFIQKPFSLPEIAMMIRDVLYGK